MEPAPPMKLFESGLDTIEGTVEDIVFYNPENGYTVCRFQVESGDELTVVGSFPPLSPGAVLKVRGRFEMNARFGKQFKAEQFTLTLPASVKGIERFLASGLVRGIGPVLAARIVAEFGRETIDILTEEPERLKQVEGIGEAKLKEVVKSWREHREIRDLIMFLQEHNVSTNLATKIYRQYGDRSFAVLKTNPYQLSLDIWGVGFKTADQIALKLGMDPGSLERVKAFILYLLEKDNEKGHVFSLASEVAEGCQGELEAEPEKTGRALAELVKAGRLIKEDLEGDQALYLPFFHQAQEEVVRRLHNLAAKPCRQPDFDLDAELAAKEKEMGITFSELQRLAIRRSFERKILVITGGPGTGKTTIVRAIVELFEKWGKGVVLAAPTGRAAKRLAEATGREARTIHRALEFSPKESKFKKNERNPLRGEAVIVDEFSMVDLPLMYHLLRAVPDWMRLIMVGDKDQLPSVGPGMLLRDIVESGTVEVVRLQEIFRQAEGSLIVVNAHRVNQGLPLVYPPRGESDSDFYFIHQEDEKKVFETILRLCSRNVPGRLGLSPLSTDIQVISPMYKGLIGVDRLNEELQDRLNPRRDGLKAGNWEFRVGDKVMQLRNDYEKEVFNGDIGSVVQLDRPRFRVVVDYDGRVVPYEKDELNDITLAYAVSVHKAQGSEYKAVIMPLLAQHFLMLQRNLFYTALTRAKKLSIIVGSYKALYIAIKNDKPVRRNSRVREKLEALKGL
jgi:exodeoxyribonuclease V alpha subunit